MRCMRQDVDANPDRLQFGSSLKDTASDSGAMKHQPERQSADPGTDDQDFHGINLWRGSNRTFYGAPAKPLRPRQRRWQETVTPERRSRRGKFREIARLPHRNARS